MMNFFQIFKKCQLSEDLKQYFEKQSRDVASFHYNSVVLKYILASDFQNICKYSDSKITSYTVCRYNYA